MRSEHSHSRRCLHHWVEAQVEKTPEAVAIMDESVQVSYAQLNLRANQLAHFLQDAGLKAGDVVGICMERSINMVTAVLGVLKAGAAYLSFDPAYPPERLTIMLQDTQPSFLLTQSGLRAVLPQGTAEVLYLDQPWPTGRTSNCKSLVTPEHPAYLIYTSGSTGMPKGVVMPHRPVHDLLWWQQELLRPKIGQRTLQFTSLSFDVSFQEIFATWISGGTLVLIREADRQNAVRLWQVLVEQEITYLYLPFVALQMLADTALTQTALPQHLRHIITAGEQLKITPQIKQLFQRLPLCRLHNQYGPSETHVVTAYTLPSDPESWPLLPPIGKPVPHTDLFILDDDRNSVSGEAAGELFLGGDCLGGGYYHRPALTAERFLPNIFASAAGQRLYCTGDKVCRLPDGQIQFLGRVDHQVKIHGYRVEPGEIETILSQFPGIQQAAVTVYENKLGHKQLAAYVVIPEHIRIPDLRHYLEEKLPPYMVPAVIVRLASLPLTASGKVDRLALPHLDFSRPELSQPYTPPETTLQKELTDIWTTVLGIEPIGIHDSFFELGGYSLAVTQIMSRIRDRFQVQPAMERFFEKPTVAALAVLIETMQWASRDMTTNNQYGAMQALNWDEGEL